MKINYKSLATLLFFTLFLVIYCGKDEEKVLGPNRLEKVEILDTPYLPADGISTTTIIAAVYDTSGYPVEGINVKFETTHGTITGSAKSNIAGEAFGILTSAASQTDLNVVVKATLQDSGSLNKSMPNKNHLVVKLQGAAESKTLKKAQAVRAISGTVQLTFVGLSFTAAIDENDISADGINSARLEVVVKETSSKKAISNATVYLRAIHNNIPGQILTDNKGVATVNITSMTRPGVDTIFVDYGTFTSIPIYMNFISPKLILFPDEGQISADGKSKLILTGRLTTFKNNPVPGARISFITNDGSITATATTNDMGDALAELVSSEMQNNNVRVIASFYEVADTSQVHFIESAGQTLFTLTGAQSVIRNGIATINFKATLYDEQQMPVKDTKIRFRANYGKIDSVGVTDEQGETEVTFTADVDTLDATDVVTAQFGSLIATLPVDLLGVSMQIAANPDSIQADGISTSQITVQLKLSGSREVIPHAELSFNSSLGNIPNLATTDLLGTAKVQLISENQAGTAMVNVFYGKLMKSVPVIFASEKPTTILLLADPNFIWVKETGNLEQTTITARVLSQTGTPVSNDVSVKFTILSGPGGGESIFPARAGSSTESVPIKTVNGEAKVTLKSGTRSGTVRIQAEAVGEYDIMARITNVVIRSGPPYMWIDPNDKNHVESHMTIAFDYVNQDGWHNVRNYEVTVYVGDRYNNPVEAGTAVYLTSTAGIITTDIVTDSKGVGHALLMSANPRPYLNPSDPFVLAPHRIPNPNDSDIMLDINVPDFEGSEVMNSLGSLGENDGITYVLARTHGCDQNLHQADQSDSTVIVYTYGSVIFSGPLYKFEVTTNKDSLAIGQAAAIIIRVYDINGNPVSQGSTLTATSSKGRLAQTNFMPSPEKYGQGSTYYATYLLNNLDPVDDKAGTAEITFNLESPNGSATQTIFIYLSLDEPE
ncbi:MAG TPA: hypothetical protein PLP19_14840 [bacterium]|nr:hypothetical protein [bacterium]HPN44766.1 hypothetical protein [bacterium]